MNNNPNSLSYCVSNINIMQKIHYKYLKIIQYNELYKVKNLLTLLPNAQLSILVILFNTSVGGHWVILIRTGNKLSYCDSYGYSPDSELQLIPKNVRQEFHEHYNLSSLIEILLNNGFKLVYNKTKLQTFQPNDNTCGKYVIFIANCFLNGYNLEQAIQYLCYLSHNLHKSPDDIVNMYYNGYLKIENKLIKF